MVLYAIGRHAVFSLGGWSPLLPTGFLVPRGTLDPGLGTVVFAYGAVTLSRAPFQKLPLTTLPILPVRNPVHPKVHGLGSARFARRYWGHLV